MSAGTATLPKGWKGRLARRGLIDEDQLLTLLAQTKMDDDLRERIRGRIAADFAQPAPG